MTFSERFFGRFHAADGKGRHAPCFRVLHRWAFAAFMLMGKILCSTVLVLHVILTLSGSDVHGHTRNIELKSSRHVQVAYVKANNLTFNAGFVAADAAAANAIAYGDVFPLGTGALSYISAAAYQLRDASILNIDQPVTNYLDPADFGYTSQWCPDVYGQPVAGTPTGQPSTGGMEIKSAPNAS